MLTDLQRMTKLKDQLSKLNKHEIEPIAILRTLLPETCKIVDVDTLLTDIQQNYGLEIGKEFFELVAKNKLPTHRALLIQYFQQTSDFTSKMLCTKLGEIDEKLKNPKCLSCANKGQ